MFNLPYTHFSADSGYPKIGFRVPFLPLNTDFLPLSIDENFIDTTNGSEIIDENYIDTTNGTEIIDENYVDESEIIDDENYIDTNGAETIDENFIDVDESEIFKHCCNFCGKSFVNNGTLRHHIKTVSNFSLFYVLTYSVFKKDWRHFRELLLGLRFWC